LVLGRIFLDVHEESRRVSIWLFPHGKLLQRF
jgi:hypothetical protein